MSSSSFNDILLSLALNSLLYSKLKSFMFSIMFLFFFSLFRESYILFCFYYRLDNLGNERSLTKFLKGVVIRDILLSSVWILSNFYKTFDYWRVIIFCIECLFLSKFLLRANIYYFYCCLCYFLYLSFLRISCL